MDLSRRLFLQLLPAGLAAAPREIECDVAVIGGGVGGCAAALGALRNGMRVVMTEETDWVGGQLTSQAVPPDEHPWIESFGCTQLYRSYRDGVRQYYRDHYPLKQEVRANRYFNPGGGTVSKLTHEPRISLAVLEQMLAPWLSSGQLRIFLRHVPVKADVEKDRVRTVSIRSVESGNERVVEASYFIDATEEGDLLPLTGTEHVTGAESQKETGEPHAPSDAQLANIQSFTFCFALAYLKGEDHTIERPAEFSFWREYKPNLQPAWPGKLLSWEMSNPITLEKREVIFDPEARTRPLGGPMNLWLYRRIFARDHFAGGFRSDITLVNWPQNDYWIGNLHGVPNEDRAKNIARAKQLSLSLLYWMQTDQGWKGLRLRHDVTGTEDGLAKYPYIRESRRIKADFTVLEQHVATALRPSGAAEKFNDSVGVGSYRIDLHPSSGGNNCIDVSSLPFQIPLGSLIPKRIENLLPGCKNLGVTHITNGCYRLHPVEWNIGESAGSLAAFALQRSVPPRQVRRDPKLLAEFQRSIQEQGIEIEWPKLLPR